MSAHKPGTIYLDNAATTQADPRVVEAMAEALLTTFGNPSSRHPAGLAAERLLRTARQRVADRCAVEAGQVVFTSGGTEALALGILGTLRRGGRPAHLLLSAIEHPAVRETARLAAEQGHAIEELSVGPDGRVDPEEVARRVRPETTLVALMHANNEVGVIQPVTECARLVKAREPRCRLLVDAVQSFGWLPCLLPALGADLLALSGHKLHGPKGIGALVLGPGVRVSPLWGGGDQEQGRRAGTENVPAAVGLGAALQFASGDAEPVRALTRRLEEAARAADPSIYPVGEARQRLPQILCLAMPGRRTEVVVNALAERGVYASSGSACHARRGLRSHVALALGIPDDHGLLRLSLSRRTTEDEVDRACSILHEVLCRP